MQPYTIGQVARASGIGIETVRFYEREGLIESPARRSSGYRQFGEDAIARLRFIKRAQRLGFTLREIKDLLALKLDPDCSRAAVRERAVAKVEDIDARIKELKRMKKALLPLIAACDGKGALEGCPILAPMDSELPLKGSTKSLRKLRKK
jgi:MerR family transcriptional regulator, copper efflux regulator